MHVRDVFLENMRREREKVLQHQEPCNPMLCSAPKRVLSLPPSLAHPCLLLSR